MLDLVGYGEEENKWRQRLTAEMEEHQGPGGLRPNFALGGSKSRGLRGGLHRTDIRSNRFDDGHSSLPWIGFTVTNCIVFNFPYSRKYHRTSHWIPSHLFFGIIPGTALVWSSRRPPHPPPTAL